MVRHADDDLDSQYPPDFDADGSTLSPGAGGPTGPVDRDEQLGEAIEAYLALAEGGVPPDPETFAADYPGLGDDLLAALEGLALVKGLVGGPNGPGHRLEEGRRVAGYRIVRELGRGGMGIVYEAVHVGLDRPVALKVLGSQAAPDSSGRRRFLNEARTAAGLHHTHIVPVFDVGQVGGLCYYAMQRIEGSGLDRILRALRRDRTVAAGSAHGSALKTGKPTTPTAIRPNHGTGNGNGNGNDPTAPPGPSLGDETLSWTGAASGLSGGGSRAAGRWRVDDEDDGPLFNPSRGSTYYRWVADVGRQAAEALAHAHQRGIIHRDIKPSNLLVDARGVIWVADFGLARRLADPSQTQVDSLLGTPRYMSPEQAKTGAIDGRADVYSLGATLYELITLRPPFDGQTAAELIDQIAGREPPRPRKFDPRVPLDLETILLKALAKRPSDRYAGAAELADDLGRFLAHEPVKARRIGPIGRTWRFARRHPGVSIVSTLAASLVLTTATVAYVRVVRERDRADEQARQTRIAKDQTDTSNRDLITVNAQYQAALVESLENQASNVLFSTVPKRRTTGLNLVKQAAELGAQMKPDQERQVRLRDQALAFLTLRDVESQPPISLPDGPRRSLVFGPNGQRVAALSDEGELAVWDAATRAPLDASRMPIAPERRGRGGRGGGFRSILTGERIAVTGDQLLVIQPDETGVRWFDIAAPDEPVDKLAIKGQQILSVLASTHGRQFLTVGLPLAPGHDRGEARFDLDEPRICLWDRDHPDGPRATLTLDQSPTEVPYNRLLLAIAPDGSKIAAARTIGTTVALWDGDGNPLDPVPIQGNVTALALGPTGQLAIAGSGGNVALWDLSMSRPKPLPAIDLHLRFIHFLRFGPRDGSMLAAADMMGHDVELWDLSTHTPIAALPTAEGVTDLAFSPDGRTLAATQAAPATEGRTPPALQSSSIAFWSLVEPTAQDVLPESGDYTGSMAFSPGNLLAIAAVEASLTSAAPLRVWGGPGQCPPSITSWPRVRPTSVNFDASGRLIAPDSDAIRWFEPPEVEPVRQVAIPTEPRSPGRPGERRFDPPPRLVARSGDGSTLLIARRDALYSWRAEAPETLTRLVTTDRDGRAEGFGRGVQSALSPDATHLYHLARRGEELIARPIDAREVHTPDWVVTVAQANSLILSPDAQTLAIGNQSGEVELRDARDGSLRSRLAVPTDDNKGPVESLAFSPDSQFLAVGGREQLRLWTVATTPRPLVRLPGYQGSVRTLAYDSAGDRLAGADDRTIKVWNLARLRGELERLGLGW